MLSPFHIYNPFILKAMMIKRILYVVNFQKSLQVADYIGENVLVIVSSIDTQGQEYTILLRRPGHIITHSISVGT